jgi:hypothetical protein
VKIITTRAHSLIDYVSALLWIALPWLAGFASNNAATRAPVILGAVTILYSLATDYEYSIVKKISLKNHLALDFVGGVVMAFSPWIFDFNQHIWLPHLVTGLVTIAINFFTSTYPIKEPPKIRQERIHKKYQKPQNK